MNSSSSSLLKPDVALSLTLPPCPNSPHEGIKPEERGIKLIRLLLTCAKHASSGNLHPWAGLYKALNHHKQPKQQPHRAHPIFSQAFLYFGFSYAVIARTLIHLIATEGVIHIIDLGSCDPKFWIPLFRGCSTLPNGIPHLKVTCFSTSKQLLDKLGRKFTKQAQALDMPFQFNPINVNLRDLSIEMLKVRPGEALALISVLNLHVLLAEDDRVDAHFGAEKSDSVKECKQMGQFLGMLRSISPKLFFLVEQEADHNLNRLVDRFVEGLNYYSAVFDSIDVTFGTKTSEERLILEEVFGREIENIAASEGLEREERHERYARWMVRFGQAGFKPVRLWVDPRQDAEQMVKTFGRDGYKIVNERTSLMVCWYDRPLSAVSAWTC